MSTTLEKIAGFDVLHIEGSYTFYEAMGLPAKVQGQHGIGDWVLPDRVTLAALQVVADGVCGGGAHWSSSPHPGRPDSAWLVDFDYGYVSLNHRSLPYAVRLVRASQCLALCKAAAEKSLKEAGIEVPVQELWMYHEENACPHCRGSGHKDDVSPPAALDSRVREPAHAIRWLAERGEAANAATTGYRANAATTGNWANAATTGDRASAATTGDGANAATTGYGANAATTGNWANAATTGDRANAATTGDRANAATTGEAANAATTGNWANAATTGYRANAATTGEAAVAAGLGRGSKAKAETGGAIVLVYREDNGTITHIRASKVGENGIKPGVWYSLNAVGEFQEHKEENE